MSPTRVYLPLSTSGLRALAGSGLAGSAPVAAHAVTERVVQTSEVNHVEEWEYAALCDAAEASGELRNEAGDRRIVVVADVPDAWVGEAAGSLSSVVLAQAVPRRLVVSVHVDEVGGGEDDELLWYDVTEIEVLLAEL